LNDGSSLALIFRYLRCILNETTFLNCPHPCNALPCNEIKHAEPLSCKLVIDKDFKPLIATNLLNTSFGNLFRRDYTCSCNEGFKWSEDNKECIIDKGICSKSPCLNGGHCNLLNNSDPITMRSYKCKIQIISILKLVYSSHSLLKVFVIIQHILEIFVKKLMIHAIRESMKQLLQLVVNLIAKDILVILNTDILVSVLSATS
jgi:hypothetical protein